MAQLSRVLGGLLTGAFLIGTTIVLLQINPKMLPDKPPEALPPSWGLSGTDPELEAKRREADAIKDKSFGSYGWISTDGRSAASAETSKATLNSTDERQAYAKRIERNLLSVGTSVDVFLEAGPQLTIFMYFSKALVYRMITESPILQDAHDRGFKKLRFMGKGAESWYFDLSKGVPRCDTIRKLCI